MNDGSRHFGSLPETTSFESLRDHLSQLPDATNTRFVTDHMLEAWINFTFRGHRFSANNQLGQWWFFVDDPACPDDILQSVLCHGAILLGHD